MRDRTSAILAAAATLALVAPPALAQEGTSRERTLSFAEADRDGDGLVSAGEIRTVLIDEMAAKLRETVLRYDANGDRALQPGEIDAMRADSTSDGDLGMFADALEAAGDGASVREVLADQMDGPRIEGMLEGMLAAADRDGDGGLDRDEFGTVSVTSGTRTNEDDGSTKREVPFAELDANGDGSLTRDEIEAFWVGEIAGAVRARIAVADADGDGRLDAREMRAIEPDEGFDAGDMRALARFADASDPVEAFVRAERERQIEGMMRGTFGLMDADGDGSVTRDEFPGMTMDVPAPSRS